MAQEYGVELNIHGGVRETSCTRCAHREVCMYKNDYLNALKAVTGATISELSSDGKMSVKKVESFDFISRIDVICRYLKEEPTLGCR